MKEQAALTLRMESIALHGVLNDAITRYQDGEDTADGTIREIRDAVALYVATARELLTGGDKS